MKLHDSRGIWLKIDGITRPDDARMCSEAGASALGMIFAPSPRRVGLSAAAAVREAIPDGVTAFGVFDGSSSTEVVRIAEELALGGVQFPRELEVPDLPDGLLVLRTVRVRTAEDLRHVPANVHFDAWDADQLGGTGKLAPWDLIESHRPDVPFVMSGGLNAGNVAECIRRLRPHGVDVSSGVESAPGVKDADKVSSFVEAARAAG